MHFSSKFHLSTLLQIIRVDYTCSEDVVPLFDKSFPAVSIISSVSSRPADTARNWATEEQDHVGDISTWTEGFSKDIKSLLAAQDMRSASASLP